MAVELTRQIQQQLSSDEKIEVLPWLRAYNIALSQPNVILFTLAHTEERAKIFNMLGPIASGQIAIFTRTNFSQDKIILENLKQNLRIGTHRGTIFHITLELLGFKKIVPVNSPVSGVKMLMSNRIDAYCDDDLAIAELFRRAGYPHDSYKKILPLASSEFHIAFFKGTSLTTMQAWSEALTKIKQNGEFNRIYQRWLGDRKAPQEVLLHRLHVHFSPEFQFVNAHGQRTLSRSALDRQPLTFWNSPATVAP